MLPKGKMARFLDKTQDSQAVTKLVEDLRQAILIYQVSTIGDLQDRAELNVSEQLSQQQSIENQISHLTVSSLP